MRVAVLGAGKIGRHHVRAYIDAGADVVAILGSTRESAQATAARLNEELGTNIKSYSDLDQLVGQESLEAVSVCTPNHLHEPHTSTALLNIGIPPYL